MDLESDPDLDLGLLARTGPRCALVKEVRKLGLEEVGMNKRERDTQTSFFNNYIDYFLVQVKHLARL